MITLPDAAQNFATVFLGILIEALPFLLLGALASGLIAVYVSADDLARIIPRNKVLAIVLGSTMGMVFPVCECGIVPVVRRLYQKGLPISAGIALLLGAPVLNPVVIASTYAAFGLGTIFWARIGFTFLISVTVGLLFVAQPNLIRILRPASLMPVMGGTQDTEDAISIAAVRRKAVHTEKVSLALKLQRAFGVAADEFFDTGRYLIVGTLIATALQTFVPQQAFIAVGAGPVSSVIVLQVMAFVLSVCSTVDAFLALSFVNTFTTGAIIVFLVFGPMVDIKSTMMFLGVFRRRPVIYLIVFPFLITLLIGIFINLNLGW